MKYQEVVNFGEEESSSTYANDLANHALVFGISSLRVSYFQPIGYFASKGPTRRSTLAKLVLQAILLLEKAGVKFCAMVCDGVRTNRKMWKEFGILGSPNSTLSISSKILTTATVKCLRHRMFRIY